MAALRRTVRASTSVRKRHTAAATLAGRSPVAQSATRGFGFLRLVGFVRDLSVVSHVVVGLGGHRLLYGSVGRAVDIVVGRLTHFGRRFFNAVVSADGLLLLLLLRFQRLRRRRRHTRRTATGRPYPD